MSEAQSEWPSEKRLISLRAHGVVPFSPTAVVLVRTTAVLVAILLIAGAGRSVKEEFKGEELSLGTLYSVISEHLFVLFLLPALLVVILGVGSALLQTLFLLPWGRLGFQWPDAQLITITSGLRVLFLQLFALAFAGGLGYWALPEVLAILTLTPSTIASVFDQKRATLVVAIAAFFLLVAAAFFAGLSHLLFRYRHRMSRDDLEHESDESAIPKVL